MDIEDGADEKILRIEAEAAVEEVRFAVQTAELSKVLPNNEQLVYINLTTKENERYCVELSVQGFRIVARDYDRIQEESMSRFYETIYALLDGISPEYRRSFGDALMTKLSQLQDRGDEAGTGDQS